MTPRLSRREFLKLGAAAAAGFAMGPLSRVNAQSRAVPCTLHRYGLHGAARPLPPSDANPVRWGLGRIAQWRLNVRTEPNRDADLLRHIYKDEVVAILDAVIGGTDPAHNRTWYALEEGYIHSGWVQPVAYNYQTPLQSFPGSRFIVEVSVPFVDARWNAHPMGKVAYRMYYGAAFWVLDITNGADGEAWYQIWDERKRRLYYVPGITMRRIRDDELAPISPQIPIELKRLYVDTDNQVVIAYEDTGAVLVAPTATGAWYFEKGQWKDYTTTPGTYRIGRKMPSRHMAGGDLVADDGFDLPGVPWVSYFSASGMAFHGTYWHNDYNKPRSHGCVNLTPENALWIYRWSSPFAPPDEDVVWSKPGEGTLIEVV